MSAPDIWIGPALLTMLVALVAGVMWSKRLVTAVILMSAYSMIVALWFLVMDAPDVAFTEAVVGAGVSTLLLLGAILLVRRREEARDWKRGVGPAIVVAAAGGLLAYAMLSLPALGDAGSPANAYVGRLYLQRALEDVGVANVVSAVLASYRGYDTLGETVVIFAGGLGVALLLGFGERALAEAPGRPPEVTGGEAHVVLRVVAKLLIPMVALFAFYVLVHGDVRSGGGFQAGVILGVAVITHSLIFGLSETMLAMPPPLVRSAAALGVLIYAGVGVASLINGGSFLDYDHLFPSGFAADAPDHGHLGQHVGILAIETGVMLTVAASMIALVYGFAGRAPDAVTAEPAP